MIQKILLFICIISGQLFGAHKKILNNPEYQNSAYKGFYFPVPSLYSAWNSDPVFVEIHQKVIANVNNPGYASWDSPVRYLQYALSRNALAAEGDFIECGVQSGKSFDIFATVLDRWDSKNRKIYGFDSFLGFAAPTQKDTHPHLGRPAFSAGDCRGLEKEQVEALLTYHRCKFELIKGWIPDCFHEHQNLQFAFAHIDVDLYESTRDAVAYVYPRMSKGGIILFDDYGYPECIGSRKAVDEYLLDKPETVIATPTGQAFLIKQ